MKAITYIPGKDELNAEFRAKKQRPSMQFGHFAFWWDDDGNICAIRISHYLEEMKDFSRDLSKTKLEGLWRGTAITEKDINENRKELLEKLEENW